MRTYTQEGEELNMQSITEQIVAQMATRWAAAIDALGAEMMADTIPVTRPAPGASFA